MLATVLCGLCECDNNLSWIILAIVVVQCDIVMWYIYKSDIVTVLV